MYADIIVDITSEQVNRPFTYIIPEHLEKVLFVGVEVIIPFGKSNKEKKGYIINIKDETNIDKSILKEIISINEKSTSANVRLIKLAAWIAQEYGSTTISALKAVLPVKQKIKKRTIKEENTEKPKQDDNLDNYEKGELVSEIALNEEQQTVFSEIKNNIEKNIRKDYLIHGITGSGKTHIYIVLMKYIVSQKKQGILLIPEIALTHQTVTRFKRYFGERVGFINSRLSGGEKYEIYKKAESGEIDIIIGPRSALFMPFDNLGLIIIDEEHELSYKSEKSPCYHAREVALHMGKTENVSVVLGSATPSVTSYYYATNSDVLYKLELHELNNRANNLGLADVKIIDMREELKNGNKEMLSEPLEEAIEDALNQNEQVMLFLNRRGYFGLVSCRSCGHIIKCDHCEVAMSYHKNREMVCHYCGHKKPFPQNCPECGSPYIGTFKVGTEQLEEYLSKKFKAAKILRMDKDTTRTKKSFEKILNDFKNKKADILIGTQMIIKGHDFPNVTVAAAICADMSLGSGGFTAGERTFDMLTQLAGRAGRGEKEGKVFIQTYNPDNYAIKASKSQDYKEFYKEEIFYRSLVGYPPTSHMLKITLQGKDSEKLNIAMKYIFLQSKRFEEKYDVKIIGPSDPYISKIKDKYRKVLYCKNDNYDILIKLRKYLEAYYNVNKGFKNMYIGFDHDPVGE